MTNADQLQPRVVATALGGTDRARVLDAIVQSTAIHRLEGMEPTELTLTLDQAALDGLATNAMIAEELGEYIAQHRSLTGFLESRSWIPLDWPGLRDPALLALKRERD